MVIIPLGHISVHVTALPHDCSLLRGFPISRARLLVLGMTKMLIPKMMNLDIPILGVTLAPLLSMSVSQLQGFHPQDPGFLVSRTSEIPIPGMSKCQLLIASLQLFGGFVLRDFTIFVATLCSALIYGILGMPKSNIILSGIFPMP
jgi:hypothetical protein